LSEFTGERVIPELVNADLLNEHLSRYRFARHFIGGLNYAPEILDAGCGSGYGAAELSGAGAVTGTDISAEAIQHARERYGQPGVRFLQAACEALPFPDTRFDLVVAFEVIEHLDRWQQLLAEAHRVLKWSGVLLVSTPNRDYYAESRGDAGPNPFHRHEFDYEEFRQALETVFPHVRIWTQNHAETIVFSPPYPTGTWLEASGAAHPSGAHFYLAACSQAPIIGNSLFSWLPSSANLLQERERHIAKLNAELEKKDAWLRQTIEAHSELQRNHEALTAELERQNNWAAELNREVVRRDTRIGELQEEQTKRLAWIGDLETQIGRARGEIGRLQTESVTLAQQAQAEIERLHAESTAQEHLAQTEIDRLRAESAEQRAQAQSAIDRLENTVVERTRWAQRLDAEIAESREELRQIKSSTWFRTGANLGLGPRPRGGQ
jgi:SAM-dependent methyltransferase